jgi:ABC-type antimicrobial peptide transport system permease subunit
MLGGIRTALRRQDAPSPVSADGVTVTSVTAGYFELMGIRITRGTSFATDTALPVAVLDEVAARRHFGGLEAVGQTIRLPFIRPPLTIIGIVEPTRGGALREQAPARVYVPFRVAPGRQAILLVRQTSGSGLARPLFEDAVRESDPGLPIEWIRSLETLLSEPAATERLYAAVLALLGTVALFLSLAGLAGVTRHAVTSRSAELAIRTALGAGRRDLTLLFLRRSFYLAMGGLMIGLPSAILGTRLIASVLFQIAPTDPLTLLAVSGLVITTSLAVSYLPIHGALRQSQRMLV